MYFCLLSDFGFAQRISELDSIFDGSRTVPLEKVSFLKESSKCLRCPTRELGATVMRSASRSTLSESYADPIDEWNQEAQE